MALEAAPSGATRSPDGGDTARAGDRARTEFHALADEAFSGLRGQEVLLVNLGGESSDFVRFNQAGVRQAGSVEQAAISLALIDGTRHVSASSTLSGNVDEDGARVAALLETLREQLAVVPEDPHLLYASEISSSDRIESAEIPERGVALSAVREHATGLDFTGLWASGVIHRGFANSLGQRNWHTGASFHLDFSVHLEADRAVKGAYAGTSWESGELSRKLDEAGRRLELLARPAVELRPGRYDAYLEPDALAEIVELLGWGGFGLRAHRTKSTPLIRMSEEDARLHPQVRFLENTAEGVAPDFQREGFRRPPVVELIEGGQLRATLVSPRSAMEFDVPTNGAGAGETPESIDLGPGDVPRDQALARLGRGVWLGNLHYLNYSDRRHCRTTGMTRFACFLVEGGEVVAPIRPMRFDETLYRVLGENLRGLTRERDMLLGSGTYGGRSTTSARLPGALVADFTFTL